MTIIAVAGTFDVLHNGHKALLDRAFSLGGEVCVGITSDKMAAVGRSRAVNPYYLRCRGVEDYAASKGRTVRIFTIDDIYGPPEMMDTADVLVVSDETLANGRKVAERRKACGGRPLELSVVSLVNNDLGIKLSSTDVRSGKCARDGNTEAVDVAVGSLNPVKVEAVRRVMERAFGSVRITACDVSSGVPPQPFGDQTVCGAINRAKAAVGDHEYGVGIEAGVFEMYGGLYDVQHCAIADRSGNITIGMGSGFRYPDSVADLVRRGMTVGDAMSQIYERDNCGKEEGAIGVLSRGLLDREQLTEQSVMAALVPRLWEER
jgi:inosine/xanthosine triphosphatase